MVLTLRGLASLCQVFLLLPRRGTLSRAGGRLAEGSIHFLKTVKVFIELGFHLCKLRLEVFESFDPLLNR